MTLTIDATDRMSMTNGDGTLLNFPAELGVQIASVAKAKSEVTLAGYQRHGTTGKTLFSAGTVNLDGRTLGITGAQGQPPSAPPPPPPRDDPDPVFVNPTTTGRGINLTAVPNPGHPSITSSTPANGAERSLKARGSQIHHVLHHFAVAEAVRKTSTPFPDHRSTYTSEAEKYTQWCIRQSFAKPSRASRELT